MLKKLQAIFDRTVDQVENKPGPFVRYYYLFAAILALRLALEFFSSRRLFTLDDILHIGLWFTFIVLAFLLQLHLFSGEKIIKVARLVIVFFSIALTAPIIDLILTKGVGAKMNYLSLHSWKDVAWSYITIGGSSLSRGATPGIRIEICLLLIASFNYVRTKRRSIIKAVIGTISIYTVLFVSGAIPFLLGHIVNTFHLQYQHDDQSTLLLLLVLDVFLLSVAFFRHSPSGICKVMRAAPWLAIVFSLLALGVGASLSLKLYPGNWMFNPTTLFWFPLLPGWVIFFAAYTGIQKLQYHATGKEQYTAIKNGLVLLLLIVSCMMSVKIFFATALLWGLLFLLYEAPLVLKRIRVLGNILEAMLLPASAFVGFSVFNAPLIGFPPIYMLLIFTAGFAGSIILQLWKRKKM